MALAQQAGEAILEKPHVAEAIARRRLAADGEVDIAPIEALGDVEIAACPDVQDDLRRLARRCDGQARRYHERCIVVDRNHEVPRGHARVECRFLAQRGSEIGKRLPHGGRQVLGLGSGLNALRHAHEQLVAKRGAQSGQGMAHRRLTHVESFGGARGVPLLHYRVEHDEKVKVDLSPVHLTSRLAAPGVRYCQTFR
jgi:hypothetical protein